MVAARPQTIGHELLAQINAVRVRNTSFLDPNGLEYRRLLNECGKLKKVEPVNGAIFEALVYELVNDEDKFRGALKNIQLLTNGSAHKYSGLITQALMYFGFTSEALTLWLKIAHPERGFFGDLSQFAGGMGGFRSLNEYYEISKAMGLTVTSPVNFEENAEVANFMAESNVEDIVLANLLDIANRIIRSHGFFCQQLVTQFISLDDEVAFWLRLGVGGDATVEDVMTMTSDLVAEIARLEDMPDRLQISFKKET